MKAHRSQTSQFPVIPDEAIKPVLVAGREIIFFGLKASAELDHIWIRESDAIAGCPSSVISRFLRLQQRHKCSDTPDSVWLHDRAIKPVPFMEAVNFWAQRAEKEGDQWAAMVVRELERLEDLVYAAFRGIDIPENQQWTSSYRDFDGRATTYHPTEVGRKAKRQQNRAVA